MGDQQDDEELRDAAREIGAEDVEEKEGDELIEAAQEAQADSASPTNPAASDD